MEVEGRRRMRLITSSDMHGKGRIGGFDVGVTVRGGCTAAVYIYEV